MIFTNNTERMRIDNSGNVGIGTTSPSFKFHVNAGGTTGVIAGFFNSTDETTEEALLQVGGTLTDNYGVMFGAKPEVSTPGVQDHAFIVKTNDDLGTDHVERFRVGSSGNVGIGETSPSTKLHITSGAPNIRLEDSDNSSYGEIVYNTAGGGLIIRSDENTSTGTSGSNIIFETDGPERMRIESGGNIGIGTSSINNPSSGRQVVELNGASEGA
jgi:hypothetical protein